MILKVLKNEKYAGDLCQKKTITPDYLSHRKKKNEGEEEMVYLKNHHTPIIDRVLWERTQKELERRSLSYHKASQCSRDVYKRQQQVIAECMEEANLAERELSRKMDAEAVSTLEEQGMKVTYPDKTEPVSYTHLDVYKRQQ